MHVVGFARKKGLFWLCARSASLVLCHFLDDSWKTVAYEFGHCFCGFLFDQTMKDDVKDDYCGIAFGKWVEKTIDCAIELAFSARLF